MNGGCFKCGARGSCKHRTVEEPEVLKEPPPDLVIKGSTYAMGGLHRKRRPYNLNSFRGKEGNPTRSEVEEIAKHMFDKDRLR